MFFPVPRGKIKIDCIIATMKIGLVLFGHLRSFRSTHESYNSFLKTLQQLGDVDVFCHTWDIEESVTTSWWKEHNNGEKPPATVDPSEIVEKYQPIRYIIEPSRQFDEKEYNINIQSSISGTLSMLYTQRQVFSLLKEYEIQNNFRYDIIVKSRYDLLFEIDSEFRTVVKDSADNKILYLPSSNPYESIGSCSDIFAVGDRNEMEKYFSFCDNIKNAIDIYFEKGYRKFLPEFCMTVYLDNVGVSRKELTGLRLHILRTNGDQLQINSDRHFNGNDVLCFYPETIKTNKAILPVNSDSITENLYHLARKYTAWVDTEAEARLVTDYADFYSGKWISISKIDRLAKRSTNASVFRPNVMKNFFEGAMHNAVYSTYKKLLFASSVVLYSNYGFVAFKVWKRNISRKKLIAGFFS